MADTDVETKVIDVIAKQAKADAASVTRETRLQDLKLESIDLVEIVFDLEDAFNISIPYNANDLGAADMTFDTVGSVIDAVAKHLHRDPNAPASS
jgi:acyl carrier protein